MTPLKFTHPRAAFVDSRGYITRDWQLFLAGLYNRTGGDTETPPVFGVVDAVGDGVTDDYLALQRAIDAAHAAGGGVVRLAPLVYLTGTQLRMKSNVTLEMAGGTIRRGFNTSALGAGLFGFEEGARQTIRGGTLDGNGQNYPTSFNIIGASDVTDLTIEGVTFLSVVNFHAVDLAGCTNVLIRDCKFFGFYNTGSRGFSEAIQLDPGTASGGTINQNVTVTGCVFGDSQDTALVNFTPWPCAMGNHSGFNGLYHRDIRFIDNSVNGADWAGLNLLNMREVLIAGNAFAGCLHGVRFRLKDDVSPAQACSDVTITGNTFKTTGGAAVKFAGPGTANIANVTTGRHTGVTITGNAASETVGQFADVAFASRVTITGNVSDASDYGITLRFSDRVSITGNDFSECDTTGVYISEGTETALAGTGLTHSLSITGNTMSRLGFRGVHVNCAAERVHVASNHIVDPSTTNPSREGIRADSAADGVSIIGNTVTFTSTVHSPYGISVSGTVTGVTIRGNSSTGSTAGYEVAAASSFIDIEGTGSPEGTYSAAIGSRYSRLDGGSTTTLYAKTSGTGNTGWEVVGSGGGGGGGGSSYFPSGF